MKPYKLLLIMLHRIGSRQLPLLRRLVSSRYYFSSSIEKYGEEELKKAHKYV